ncbi:hypothetical protein E1A91_A12G085800v1 [Gossypium mustelinum]|uniref:peptidylprolyl isomerase n=3 Tax=Gossypium TaxID=3633 RepID=A0A5J5TDH6_GOSBA|nr:hypothetical protein ES319_A12G084400v1 [Gossypium barbadense]TYG89324.1 hypothetical protein ES288_A12G091100v1 [Gossypium darwinii]TYJ04341.1 hypothetical protein E1A91_A12G085800v1 [Gossypium mustelinum]
MKSLPLSAGTYIPKILNPKILNKNVENPVIRWSKTKPKMGSIAIVEQQNDKAIVLLKRREAVGLGLYVGIADVLLQLLPQPCPSGAAVEVAPAACELTVSPSGLAFCDKVVGKGPEAVKGQLIKVIKGWDQGILGGDGVPPMLAGGKRTLRLPPELGYGMRGAGCKGGSCIIPPDSVLLFDVEFIGKA